MFHITLPGLVRFSVVCLFCDLIGFVLGSYLALGFDKVYELRFGDPIRRRSLG
jgi:hypothetical protein